MFKNTDIKHELVKQRAKSAGERLVTEASRILKREQLSNISILSNLREYNRSFELLDEDALDDALIFTPAEIKEVCVHHRLKFLESKIYKFEIPYEAVLRIKSLNSQFHKQVREFRVLAPPTAFTKTKSVLKGDVALFVKTNYDNYYLVHRWGQALPWYRRIAYWPLRYFENLFVTVIAVTLTIALSLPTGLITLDNKAEYWSGYRAAAFFHLLIFNMGVTAYFTFAFAKNFSSSIWNRERDFD